MNLFEINDNIRKIKQFYDDPDHDQSALKDTLDSLQDTRESKLDGIAGWIESNNAKEEWLVKKIRELSEAKKHLHNQTGQLMQYMTEAIDGAKTAAENQTLMKWYVQYSDKKVPLVNVVKAAMVDKNEKALAFLKSLTGNDHVAAQQIYNRHLYEAKKATANG